MPWGSWLQHLNCIGTKKALRAGTLESRKGFALSTRGFSASDVSSVSLFSPFADGTGLAPIPGHSTAGASLVPLLIEGAFLLEDLPDFHGQHRPDGVDRLVAG